jgi:hypothetical protein
LRHVYDNLDPLNVDKIYAGTNSTFDEIIWLYPSKEPAYEVITSVVMNGGANAFFIPLPTSQLTDLRIFLDGVAFSAFTVFDSPLDPGVSSFIVLGIQPPSDTLLEAKLPAAHKENDNYVIYNVAEQHWTIGTLDRTVWEDSSTFSYPLALGSDSADLYYHEFGYSADNQPLAAHLDGAFFDSEDGNSIMFANKFTPDFSNLEDNDPYSGNLNISFSSRKYVGGPIITKGPYRVSASTQRLSPRLRGREFAIRIESSTVASEPWRMGKLRMAIGPDGLR